MKTIAASHPILTCDEARELEAALFRGDETREWAAMQRAGAAVADAVLQDFEEIGGLPPDGRLLVLVGKGHNGGDALIAATRLLQRFSTAGAEVVFVFGERKLRPLATRAWRELLQAAPDRVRGSADIPAAAPSRAGETPARSRYDVCLDGVFGFQFRPPCDPETTRSLVAANALPVRLRAAIDLPSAGIFRADFTYATGSVKRPVLDRDEAGRVRYLDLGFFRDGAAGAARVLTPAVLAPLAALRAPRSDKRSYGHVFVLGGSRSYPGAVLMTAEAAVRSGAGLVTAFVPETLASAFAARLPEAIWVGWPETPDGGLALEGLHLLRERLERADALVAGPGISREAEVLALVKEVVRMVDVPVVLDADTLQREIVEAAKTPLVVTPHAGEFARLAGEDTLEQYAFARTITVVLKGPVTRIAKAVPAARGAGPAGVVVYHSFFGGPVLARGGSGDVLAGMIGTQLAQIPEDPALAAARALVWHGMAADRLARAHGQVAVTTTRLLDFLPAVLRHAGVAGASSP